jgi:hypothetical protein
MTDRRVAELREKLGHSTCETIQILPLLKAFVRLPSSQRAELIELIELSRDRTASCPQAISRHIERSGPN